MQPSLPHALEPFALKTTPNGMPHPDSPLIDGSSLSEHDNIAAMGCAIYTKAQEMTNKLGLGMLHVVECHLNSGVIVIHQANECGDLWIKDAVAHAA